MALKTELKTQGDFLFRNRSYLPILILVVGLGVSLYGEFIEVKDLQKIGEHNFEIICLAISLLGLAIRILTVGYTPKNTSGRNTSAGQIADEINTTGMYSLLRHPLYLGNFFMWLGVAMLAENLWFTVAFILLYGLYYERIMYAEENFLIDKFGSNYLNWAANTPAFIPNFKNYTVPKYPFSIKKVLKKEKNGFTAIFLLFWLFDWSGSQMEKGVLHLELNFWLYAAILSGVIYLVLKIMKKRKMFTELDR